ncbi:hypothetical protein PY093_11065 [Cytobacillus sp. S13-E01]|uniref:hypothetical protein n=1 Tax=Cytobacillus sp. S13-E01 TaxID=3031326 RepID=UPI0023D8303A|nr:hypothetical protein [Cytobacillus sp. S13-E01]MDF0727238.1 hypothetical protein [Cytobacillus sp. S13-E01]
MTELNGIVKRRKTSDYAQIHNTALQQLEDIRSIGLISHLMSLPESWVISKMQLYSKFGRGPITNAIKELEAKKYWVTIKYREGKKTFYYYNVSDVAFDDTEVLAMIWEVKGAGFKILAISQSFQHLVSIGENRQPKGSDETQDPSEIVSSSIVGSQQLTVNNSPSTVENQQVINKEVKKETKKNKKTKNKHSNTYFEEEGNAESQPKGKLKFQSDFSNDEIIEAKKFIAPQMIETFNDLVLSDEFKDRIICYMAMAGMKYISASEIRKKHLEIERGKKHIADKAFYIVKGVLLNRHSANGDQLEYSLEKAKKQQQEQKAQREKEMLHRMLHGTEERTVPFYNWLEE